MRRKGRQIAIVGGGATGVLLALQLLRRPCQIARVVMIERNVPPALGVAYRTTSDSHLLNSRADRMDAIDELPGEFVSWLGAHAVDPAPACSLAEAFVPRPLFGAYLRAILWRESRGSDVLFELLHDDAIGLDEDERSVSIRLNSGAALTGLDAVVLAPGHFPPSADSPPYFFGNAWDANALASLPPVGTVLLIGTGLTMMDTVCSLLDRRHRGSIHAISRHGLLPLPHAAHRMAPLSFIATGTPSLRRLVRDLRATAGDLAGDADAWQGLFEHLRDWAPTIWQRLPVAEQRRFLRHVRPWWEIHRHRVAPTVAARIAGAVRSGQLRVYAGRMKALENGARAATARLRLRGRAEMVKLRVARVVDCSGPRPYAKVNDVLLQGIFRNGQAQHDVHGLGLKVDAKCRIVGRDGYPSPRIFAAGPATRGTFWEINAIPEIRRQSAGIAATLAGQSQGK